MQLPAGYVGASATRAHVLLRVHQTLAPSRGPPPRDPHTAPSPSPLLPGGLRKRWAPSPFKWELTVQSGGLWVPRGEGLLPAPPASSPGPPTARPTLPGRKPAPVLPLLGSLPPTMWPSDGTTAPSPCSLPALLTAPSPPIPWKGPEELRRPGSETHLPLITELAAEPPAPAQLTWEGLRVHR